MTLMETQISMACRWVFLKVWCKHNLAPQLVVLEHMTCIQTFQLLILSLTYWKTINHICLCSKATEAHDPAKILSNSNNFNPQGLDTTALVLGIIQIDKITRSCLMSSTRVDLICSRSAALQQCHIDCLKSLHVLHQVAHPTRNSALIQLLLTTVEMLKLLLLPSSMRSDNSFERFWCVNGKFLRNWLHRSQWKVDIKLCMLYMRAN